MSDVAFIVGVPRSGTTLLAECLARHPDIAITPETHFFRRFCRSPESVGKTLPGARAAHIRAEIGAILGIPDISAISEDPRLRPKVRQSLKSLIQDLFAEYRKSHDRGVLIEKTPDHLLFVPAIRACFPDAKFIHIVRDPRDVALSWQGVPWNPAGILWPGWKWRAVNAIALGNFENFPEDAITIRYEDLLGDTQSTLAAVTGFLGLPEAPEINGKAVDTSAKTFDIAKEPWKANASGPVIENNTGKWRTDMSPETRYLYDRMMGQLLTRLGYSPSGETFRTISVMRLCRHIVEEVVATARHAPVSVGKYLGLIKR